MDRPLPPPDLDQLPVHPDQDLPPKDLDLPVYYIIKPCEAK
jgi:hypothetical protein